MSQVLHRRLAELRRRMLGLGAAAGLGWGLVAGAVALLAGMWLDLVLELPAGLRLGWGMAAGGFGFGLLLYTVISALRGGGAGSMARRLDQVGNTGGQILAGVDLSRGEISAGVGSDAAVSHGLARIAVERAATLADSISSSTALPAKPLRWPSLAIGLLCLLISIAWTAAPRLAATQWARFSDPYGDHPPYSRVTLAIEPGDAKVIYGGGLEVRATTEGGLVDRLEVVLRSAGSQADEVLPMFQEATGKWRASIGKIVSPGTYLVRGGEARSRKFGIQVVTVPKLENVRFRIVPPAYTNRPPYEGPLPQGGLSGLLGTTVQVIAKSNRPLSGGELQIVADGSSTTRPAGEQQTMKAAAAGSNEAIGSFVIQYPGKMQLKVVDVAGQPSNESFTAPITVLADERPFVRMLQPQANSFATPGTSIPVEIIAEDDYGVMRVQLFRSLNDSRSLPMDVNVPHPFPTRVPVTGSLPLSEYGLQPGDVIKLYARVEDNDPAGPKGSESPVVNVRIISEEDYQRMILARQGLEVLESKYQQANRRLEADIAELDKLQKELEKKDPNGELDEASRKKIDDLADQMAQDAREIEEAASQDLPFDLDKALKGELGKAADALKDAEKDTRKGSGKGLGASAAKKELDKARKKLAGEQQDFQQNAMEPLDHLAKVFPLIEDESRFTELYQRQRDLEGRLASLKGRDSGDDPQLKARMRDLEAEQRQLRESLRDLLDEIDKHVAELPQDQKLDDLRKTAGEFATAVRESTASQEMASAEAGLAEFSGTRGHAGAKQAADTLEKFLAKCDGMGEQAGQCLKFQPKLASSMGNTVNQLLESAGLGTGQGMGAGSGGGYTAMRSTLRNVGLYGNLPTRSMMSGRERGGKADRGLATRSPEESDSGSPGNLKTSSRTREAGEADAAVPVQYKRRVGDYFQRVADELGEGEQREDRK